MSTLLNPHDPHGSAYPGASGSVLHWRYWQSFNPALTRSLLRMRFDGGGHNGGAEAVAQSEARWIVDTPK